MWEINFKIQIKLFPAGCPARDPSDGSFNLFYFLWFFVELGILDFVGAYWEEWKSGEFKFGWNDPVILDGNLLNESCPLTELAPLTLKFCFFPLTFGKVAFPPSDRFAVAYMFTLREAAVGWMLFWWRIVKFSTSLCLFCFSYLTSLSLLILAMFNYNWFKFWFISCV